MEGIGKQRIGVWQISWTCSDFKPTSMEVEQATKAYQEETDSKATEQKL
jgi:hypothetical protein